MDIKSEVLKYWENIEPKKRLKLVKILLVGSVLVFITILYYVSGRGEGKVDEVVTEDALDVIDVGEARLEDDIRSQVMKEREEINERQHVQEKKLERMRKELEDIKNREKEIAAMRSALDMLNSKVGQVGVDRGIHLPDGGDVEDSEIGGSDIPSFVGGIGRLVVSQERVPDPKKKRPSSIFL